jgi:GMP synthase (glutamine-hydrolysing)
LSVLFVLTEHAGALTSERRERYETWRGRLTEVLGAEVESVHYEALEAPTAEALVLSGSFDAWAMHDRRHLGRLYEALRRYPGPVLGICAGMQLLTWFGGGEVKPLGRPPEAAVGFQPIEIVAPDDPLFHSLERKPEVFQEHTHHVSRLPVGFEVLATGSRCPVQALRRTGQPVWGVQFHPEAWDETRPAGERVLRNFFAAARSGG